MILIDYSQLAIVSSMSYKDELIKICKKLKKESEREIKRELLIEMKRYIRMPILTALQEINKKFSSEYGKILIACDAKNSYWRHDVFPYYKASRKKSHDKDDLDWKLYFKLLYSVSDEIRTNLPYQFINLPKCEADDIIAVMCKYLQTNELNTEGLVESPQPIIIISGDKDFIQLQYNFRNVRQYSPLKKAYMEYTRKEIEEYKYSKIATGDSGDGIPNVLSEDSVIVTEGVRQNRLMKARKEEFISMKGRPACRTDEERRYWDRNYLLIDFESIPEEIEKSIIDEFEKKDIIGNGVSMFNYLSECGIANRVKDF